MKSRFIVITLACVLLFTAFSANAYAKKINYTVVDENNIKMDSPVRSFEMGSREVRADLVIDLYNLSEATKSLDIIDSSRTVRLNVAEIPKDWDVAIWDRFFDLKVNEIVVEPPKSKNMPSQSLRLRIDLPDQRPDPGKYSFQVEVVSPDGKIKYDNAKYTVIVPSPPASTDTGVSVSSTFPVLTGSVTSEFEFEIVIVNDTGADSSFKLEGEAVNANAQALTGWQISYAPSFGGDRLIASISVSDALSERVDVKVKPPSNTEPGDYFIPVKISDDAGFEATTLLQITLKGQGEIITSTDTGLLNVDAVAGEQALTKLRITNIGTGELTNLSLLADAPQGWEVDFEITEVASLPAANMIDVPISITPGKDAIPGDYLITLRTIHPDTSDYLEIRVTVAQSTIWGWLGILLVVVVIGGLAGLYWRIGRR
ncbi:MAG: hypothetical protein FI734_06240 [SAR202 cluster bacterium]|nr:hypothetical protein [SAR202 cluster bacterium]|tara:strand:- start:4375 stop:5658 length:1284 start_codon:yes stop_codon:yes gene_type:complete